MYKTIIILSTAGLFTVLFLYLNSDQALPEANSQEQAVLIEAPAVEASYAKEKSTELLVQNIETPIAQNIETPSEYQSGLTAYISPETGELTTEPTTARPANANATTNRSKSAKSAPVKFTNYKDGMVRADLYDNFMVPQTATVDCNGELSIEHNEQAEAANPCVVK